MTLSNRQRKEFESLIKEITNRPFRIEPSNGGFYEVWIEPLTDPIYEKPNLDKQGKQRFKSKIRKALRSESLVEMINNIPIEELPEPTASDGAIYEAVSKPVSNEELDMLTTPLIVEDNQQQAINSLSVLVRMETNERQLILRSLSLEDLDTLANDCLNAKKSKKEDALIQILDIIETNQLNPEDVVKELGLNPEPKEPNDESTLDLESELRKWITEELDKNPETRHIHFRKEWESRFKGIQILSNWKTNSIYNEVKKEMNN